MNFYPVTIFKHFTQSNIRIAALVLHGCSFMYMFFCFVFFLVLNCDAVVVIFFSDEQSQKWTNANLLKPPPPSSPCNFIAGRPKAALLFWFFGDFRCGVLFFMGILVIYKYKNR